MITFKSDLIDLKLDKDGFETNLHFVGHNLVWLDVSSKEELQLYMAVKDAKTNLTKVMIDHTVIPRGSFLSLFSNKLISDKIIFIRTTKKASIWYESHSVE